MCSDQASLPSEQQTQVLKRAIAESFVAGFRSVVLLASALSVAGCLSAALLIDTKTALARCGDEP
jgi:hypothetical protein